MHDIQERTNHNFATHTHLRAELDDAGRCVVVGQLHDLALDLRIGVWFVYVCVCQYGNGRSRHTGESAMQTWHLPASGSGPPAHAFPPATSPWVSALPTSAPNPAARVHTVEKGRAMRPKLAAWEHAHTNKHLDYVEVLLQRRSLAPLGRLAFLSAARNTHESRCVRLLRRVKPSSRRRHGAF